MKKSNYISPDSEILFIMSGNEILAGSATGNESYDELADQGEFFNNL